MSTDLALLYFLLAGIAFLYASVGHGGASGYLAVMSLIGLSPAVMKPSALVMNLAVSLFSFIGFYRAGFFRFQKFWPFALASIPMAFLGGTFNLADNIYKKILALCLIISIARMLFSMHDNTQTKAIPLWAGLLAGACIGLLSGMLGIGGGIILSPLLLLMAWANMKETAAISALFIFVNSIAGLLGFLQKNTLALPQFMQYGLLVTIVAGLAGSYFGSRKFNIPTLRYLLALGLGIASLKLLFT